MIYHDKKTQKNFNIKLLAGMALVGVLFFCLMLPSSGSIAFKTICCLFLLMIIFGYRYYYIEINDDAQLVLRGYPLKLIRFKYNLADIKVIRVINYNFNMAFCVWVIKGKGQARMFRTIKLPAAAIDTFLADLQAKGIKADYECIERKKE